MADKPGGDKKPGGGGGGDKKKSAPGQSLEQKIFVFIGVFVLVTLIVIPAILSFFNLDSSVIFSLDGLKEFFITIVSKTFVFVTFVSVFLILLFVLGLVYVKGRYKNVMDQWANSASSTGLPQSNSGIPYTAPSAGGVTIPTTSVVLPGTGEAVAIHGPEARGGNEKWLDIETKINSANPGDWRLAILEADIVLFDMLEEMGIPGNSIGEKLKVSDRNFFRTLNEAWSAHKIRNIIAHEGASYQLSYNEAKRAIDMYRRVFEEFYFI